MTNNAESKCAIAATVAAIVVCFASFLPWGEITTTATALPGQEMVNEVLFGRKMPSVTYTMSAWNGSLAMGGLKFPNWLVVVVAGSVAAICWLKARSIWRPSAALPMALSVYGALHASLIVITQTVAKNGSAGIGSLITVFAFVAMIIFIAQQARSEQSLDVNKETLPVA